MPSIRFHITLFIDISPPEPILYQCVSEILLLKMEDTTLDLN